jgi:hypothetical protein
LITHFLNLRLFVFIFLVLSFTTSFALKAQGLLLPPIHEPEASDAESVDPIRNVVRDSFEALGVKVLDRSLAPYLPIGGWDAAHKKYRSPNWAQDLSRGLKNTFPDSALLSVNANGEDQSSLLVELFFLKDQKKVSVKIAKTTNSLIYSSAREISLWAAGELKKNNFPFSKTTNASLSLLPVEAPARLASLFPSNVNPKAYSAYQKACLLESLGQYDQALTELSVSLSNDGYFYFNAQHYLGLWKEYSIRRTLSGYSDWLGSYEQSFSLLLPTLSLSPEHPRLNRVAGFLAIKLLLAETATSLFRSDAFIQTKDAEYEKLTIDYYSAFSNKAGTTDDAEKKIFESYRRVIKLENSSESYVNYSRALLVQADKEYKQGKTKSAASLYSAIKKNLDRALQLDPNNPWVNDVFALFYMDTYNHTYFRNAVALGSALTAIQKSGGNIPAIMYTTAKAYWANGQISMTYVSMEKLIKLSSKKEYLDAYEKFKNP